MGDRRRHQRFVLADGCEGTLRSLEDVIVEKVSEHELLLISVTPAKLGEIVAVEVPGEQDNGNAVFNGSIAECQPVMTDGTLRHRLVVRVERQADDGLDTARSTAEHRPAN